jgi:MFS family permease
VPGAILLGIGMVALVIGLALGPVIGWLPLPAVLLAACAAALTTFALWQNRTEAAGRDPLIPPQVVGIPAAWIGMLMALVFFAGFGTFLYNFALTSQTGHGDSAAIFGLTFGLFAAAFLVVSLLVPRVVGRLGGTGTMVHGTVVQAISLLGVAWASAAAPAPEWNLWFQLPGVVLGAAQALQFGPLVGTVVGAVPDRGAGLSGGLISTMQQAGIAVGVALLGALFHSFASAFGYDIGCSLAYLIQALLSVAFGSGAWHLLRAARRRTRRPDNSAYACLEQCTKRPHTGSCTTKRALPTHLRAPSSTSPKTTSGSRRNRNGPSRGA